MAITTVAPESVYSTITLKNVDWETYEKLRDEPRNDRVRMTYLDGTLILMSPEYIHDRDVNYFDLLVLGVCAGLGISLAGIRSATLRRSEASPTLGGGKEPDTAFYIGANERRMRRKKELVLGIDPPPDLAIEVHNKHDSKLAMAVYARLGVPEVWRYDVRSNTLRFALLEDEVYVEYDRSRVLPRLTTALVLQAFDARDEADMDDIEWLDSLREWARNLPEPPA